MKYPIFNFEYSKIQEYLESLQTLSERFHYLFFIKKELGNLIFLLSTTELANYNFNLKEDSFVLFTEPGEFHKFIKDLKDLETVHDLPRLKEIIDLFSGEAKKFQKLIIELGKKENKKDKPTIAFNYNMIKEEIKDYLRVLQKCENSILNEIDYLKETIELEKENSRQEQTSFKKIRWQGTESQFVYCFEQLVKAKLLDDDFLDTTGGGFSLMAKYFQNKQGKSFKNTQLANTYQNLAINKMTPGKPKGGEKIDKAISKTRIK
jgi:hypothetical protein